MDLNFKYQLIDIFGINSISTVVPLKQMCIEVYILLKLLKSIVTYILNQKLC